MHSAVDAKAKWSVACDRFASAQPSRVALKSRSTCPAFPGLQDVKEADMCCSYRHTLPEDVGLCRPLSGRLASDVRSLKQPPPSCPLPVLLTQHDFNALLCWLLVLACLRRNCQRMLGVFILHCVSSPSNQASAHYLTVFRRRASYDSCLAKTLVCVS